MKTFSLKYFFFDVLFNTHQDLNFAQYPVVIQTLGNELTVDLTIYSIDQNYQINFLKSLQFFILQFFIFRIKEYFEKRIFNLYHIANNIVASYKIDMNVHKIAFKMFVAF